MYSENISYQIVINAYLREVEHSWQRQAVNKHDCPESWQDIDEEIRIRLPAQASEIRIGIRYWSLTLRHQFIFPILCRSLSSNTANTNSWQPLEYSHFIGLTMREEGLNNQRGSGELNTLMLRCLLSQQNTRQFIDKRGEEIQTLNDGRTLSFIDSEQSLVIGHQLHPIAKSREGFSSADLENYSPETAGRFQLHYFIADMSMIHQDSALTDSAADIIKQLLGTQLETATDIDPRLLHAFSDNNKGLIPVHPWQAGYLCHLDEVKTLLESGHLEYIGPQGAPFTATTSVRTVFNEDCPFMLKFSLNVRITNSERINKHWELDRVVETARLMQMPVADDIKATAPDFEIVQEPAYISLIVDGKVMDGFSCIFRDAEAFIDPNRDITAVTSLVQDSPCNTNGQQQSRLFNIINNISTSEKRDLNVVAMDWFDRYITVSIESLMKLFIEWGLCFEPHGQNTLIEMQDGYPSRCFCRDGQGFFHRQASHDDWCKIMPAKGEETESIFPEDLARERLIYYPFINQVFSIINALGTQGLAQESDLMARLRQRMASLAKEPQRYPFSLLDVLDNAEQLPCKGNLLTQLYNMDELVGDIATQSVYVTIPNVYLSNQSK